MENLFHELGIDMQLHFQLLQTLDLEQVALETVQTLKELAPLADDDDWEF